MRHAISKNLGSATLILAALAAVPTARAQYFVYYYFTGPDGATPLSSLLLSGDTFYGTTYGGGAFNAGAVVSFNTITEEETVLHSFVGGPADGAAPIGGLVADSSGNLYGTTYGGGANFFGTLFKITPGGVFTLLHSFQGYPVEGAGPSGTLAISNAATLFGTTYAGGNSLASGSLFELTAAGAYTTTMFPYGGLPRAGLLLENGNLYGTAYQGSSDHTGGTVYQVGMQTPLFTFTGGATGAHPMAALIGDGQGNLYGTTSNGGGGVYGNGAGVIFKVNIATSQETVLHTFSGPDGSLPTGSLYRDSLGNLYGTTEFGGASGNGTLFVLNTSNQLTTLYSFPGGADGANPAAGVVPDSQGNLWGVASAGGFGYGLIFEYSLNGN